jgi:hypothetical protein
VFLQANSVIVFKMSIHPPSRQHLVLSGLLLPRRELWVVAMDRVALRGSEVVHGGWSDVLDGGLREQIG